MRKLLILLIVSGVLLISLAPFTLTGQLQTFLPQIYDKLANLAGQQTSVKPKLEVSVKENSSYWERKGASDLSELISQVDFSVSNMGDSLAENVVVTARIDGESVNAFSIELLRPSETFSDSITVSAVNNSARIVTVEALSDLSFATKTLIVNANQTRTFDKTLCRSFVTPKDKSVIELKDQILRDKTVLTLDWMALRDWVGTNVQYVSDREIHGKNDFWQFPNETIPLRTGDCEDFSLLLCALFRADGWSPDSVYVVIGEQNNQYHAWVRLVWEDLEYNIEPQGNGLAIAMGDILSLSGYDANYYFNDEKFGTFE